MKILIVSSEIVVNKYSASVCTAKIVESLSSKYEVDLLTEPMSIFDFNHNLINIYLTHYNPKNEIKLNIIEKFLLKYFQFNYRFYRRRKAFNFRLKKILEKNYDLIMAFGGGGFFEPLHATSNQIGKFKKLGYVHDPYPGDVYPKPYQSKSNTFSNKEKLKLQKIINRLDYIAFPSQYLSQWMNKFYTYPDYKVKIIPHLLPINNRKSTVSATIIDNFLDEYLIEEDNFYLHTGTLLKHRPINKIIEAFESLIYEGKLSKGFKMVFIGNINYEIPKHNINTVVILNKRLPIDLINGIAAKSAALMIIEHIGEFSPFLPGKVPEYIALKKPIMHFGPNNSETVRILKSNNVHDYFSAELDDINEIKSVLIKGGVKLHENKKIIEYFSIDSFTKQLNELK
jgi:glycosyltransferase involved in cell wall biosynthesis